MTFAVKINKLSKRFRLTRFYLEICKWEKQAKFSNRKGIEMVGKNVSLQCTSGAMVGAGGKFPHHIVN